jgi:hypothetical protein
MMKFKRPITREIELGGERVAVTMGEQGISFRPVGSRKPPRDLSWPAILCCATGQPLLASNEASPESITAALQTLKGAPASPSKPAAEPGAEAALPASSGQESPPTAPSSQEPPAIAESSQEIVHHETVESAPQKPSEQA